MISTVDLRRAGLASGATAAGLWIWIAIQQAPRLSALGPVCSAAGASGVFGHCLACVPAATLSGLSLAAAAIARRRALKERAGAVPLRA